MREIKFRAWSVTGDMWSWEEINEKGRLYEFLNYIDIFLPLQYTGLKDKRGVEIYEGDMLGGVFLGCYVFCCDTCKSFQLHTEPDGCLACEGDVHWNEVVGEENLLVVGNIYEAPEPTECGGE